MATQTDKIQRLEDELVDLENRLTYYGELFNDDGRIDDKEQQDLDKMKAAIKKIKARITKIKNAKLAKLKKRKLVDKNIRSAKNLISQLENVFVEKNLKETSYSKLQDYSMDIASISERINKSGVLDKKAQSLVDELDTWDKKIHEAIEKKTTSIKKKPKISTGLKITNNDYTWIPKITGEIKWKNQKAPIIIKNLETIPNFTIPWNTKGTIRLNLSLSFSFKTMPQKEYKQKRVVYGEFSVDEQGQFNMDLNELSSTETSFGIESVIMDFIELKLKKIENLFKKDESPGITDFLKFGADNITSIAPLLTMIKDKIGKDSFNANISAVAQKNSIKIKTMHKISDTTIDLSVAPFNLGAGLQIVIPGSNETNSIATIKFEAEKNKPKVITLPKPNIIQFEKEGEFALDKKDELDLDNWFKSVEKDLKNKLTAIEQKKNTSKDSINDIVDDLVSSILLGDKYSVTIKGFTSSTETDHKNNDLGRKRASNIKDYLVNTLKLKDSRIRITTDGEDKCKEVNGDNSSAVNCKIGTVKFSINLQNLK